MSPASSRPANPQSRRVSPGIRPAFRLRCAHASARHPAGRCVRRLTGLRHGPRQAKHHQGFPDLIPADLRTPALLPDKYESSCILHPRLNPVETHCMRLSTVAIAKTNGSPGSGLGWITETHAMRLYARMERSLKRSRSAYNLHRSYLVPLR